MIIGNRIRKIRRLNNLSMQKIVDLLEEKWGIYTTTKSIRQYERGEVCPNSRTKLKAIADILNVPISYFIEEDEGLLQLIHFYGMLHKTQQNKLKNILSYHIFTEL